MKLEAFKGIFIFKLIIQRKNRDERPCGPRGREKEHLCVIARIAAFSLDDIPFCFSKSFAWPNGASIIRICKLLSYPHSKSLYTKNYMLKHLGYSRTLKRLVNQPNFSEFLEEICHMHLICFMKNIFFPYINSIKLLKCRIQALCVLLIKNIAGILYSLLLIFSSFLIILMFLIHFLILVFQF